MTHLKNSSDHHPLDRSVLKGALLLTISLFFLAMGYTIVYGVLPRLNLFFVFGLQQIAAFLLLAPWLCRSHVWRTERYPLHALRTLFGTLSACLLFAALRFMQVVEANTLAYMAPFIMPFVARVWLKEGIARRVWLALAIGFLGVLFVIKPGYGVFQESGALALLSAFCLAIAMISIRKLIGTESYKTVIFYYLFQTACIGVLFIFLTWPASWNASDILMVCLMGFFQALSQIFLALAFKAASPARIAPVNYMFILFVAITGWLFYGQIPTASTCVGIVLILIGGLIATWNHFIQFLFPHKKI